MKLSISKRFSLIALSTIMALSLTALFSTTIAVSTASAHANHAQRPMSGSGAVVHTHVATAANSAGNWTDIDNTAANNNPNAVVIVTPNQNAGLHGVLDTHAVGVWYDAIAGKWAIFNEDGTSVPHGAAFNVYAVPAASSQNTEGALTLTVTSANSKGNWAYIDNTNTNNNPNIFFNVTPSWNGTSGTLDTHPVGVWYDTAARKWAIFNEGSMNAIPVGSTFNLFIDDPIVQGVFLHQASSANIAGNATTLNNASTNNDPSALVFVTSNFNPHAHGGTYEDHVLAVSYQNGKWSIFNADGAAMSTSAAFDVLASNPYPTA